MDTTQGQFFKVSYNWFEFPFPKLVVSPALYPYFLWVDGFLPFRLCEMQTASSRFWTWAYLSQFTALSVESTEYVYHTSEEE